MSQARLQAQIALCLAEVAQSHRRADHQRMVIHNKQYKEKVGNVRWGYGGDLLTEEEVLKGEVATHQAHIQRAEDLLDHAKELLSQLE